MGTGDLDGLLRQFEEKYRFGVEGTGESHICSLEEIVEDQQGHEKLIKGGYEELSQRFRYFAYKSLAKSSQDPQDTIEYLYNMLKLVSKDPETADQEKKYIWKSMYNCSRQWTWYGMELCSADQLMLFPMDSIDACLDLFWTFYNRADFDQCCKLLQRLAHYFPFRSADLEELTLSFGYRGQFRTIEPKDKSLPTTILDGTNAELFLEHLVQSGGECIVSDIVLESKKKDPEPEVKRKPDEGVQGRKSTRLLQKRDQGPDIQTEKCGRLEEIFDKNIQIYGQTLMTWLEASSPKEDTKSRYLTTELEGLLRSCKLQCPTRGIDLMNTIVQFMVERDMYGQDPLVHELHPYLFKLFIHLDDYGKLDTKFVDDKTRLAQTLVFGCSLMLMDSEIKGYLLDRWWGKLTYLLYMDEELREMLWDGQQWLQLCHCMSSQEYGRARTILETWEPLPGKAHNAMKSKSRELEVKEIHQRLSELYRQHWFEHLVEFGNQHKEIIVNDLCKISGVVFMIVYSMEKAAKAEPGLLNRLLDESTRLLANMETIRDQEAKLIFLILSTINRFQVHIQNKEIVPLIWHKSRFEKTRLSRLSKGMLYELSIVTLEQYFSKWGQDMTKMVELIDTGMLLNDSGIKKGKGTEEAFVFQRIRESRDNLIKLLIRLYQEEGSGNSCTKVWNLIKIMHPGLDVQDVRSFSKLKKRVDKDEWHEIVWHYVNRLEQLDDIESFERQRFETIISDLDKSHGIVCTQRLLDVRQRMEGPNDLFGFCQRFDQMCRMLDIETATNLSPVVQGLNELAQGFHQQLFGQSMPWLRFQIPEQIPNSVENRLKQKVYLLSSRLKTDSAPEKVDLQLEHCIKALVYNQIIGHRGDSLSILDRLFSLCWEQYTLFFHVRCGEQGIGILARSLVVLEKIWPQNKWRYLVPLLHLIDQTRDTLVKLDLFPAIAGMQNLCSYLTVLSTRINLLLFEMECQEEHLFDAAQKCGKLALHGLGRVDWAMDLYRKCGQKSRCAYLTFVYKLYRKYGHEHISLLQQELDPSEPNMFMALIKEYQKMKESDHAIRYRISRIYCDQLKEYKAAYQQLQTLFNLHRNPLFNVDLEVETPGQLQLCMIKYSKHFVKCLFLCRMGRELKLFLHRLQGTVFLTPRSIDQIAETGQEYLRQMNGQETDLSEFG